ncbi:MAG TPA: histidine--tRNA ligase [Candidatus Eisenbacteria bacterium]|nr:histidine--tRNA ligase [Candidatus Eisenbacteria bacterium]
MTLQAPRGTQDILPERTPRWQFVEERVHRIMVRYGYSELRTPMFESTELFQRGVGTSTDIVQKEMYTFQDRKGRSLTLRPEGTAAVVRALIEHKLLAGGQPQKIYYLGPMFRYERPQAGRYRQHHQVGAELLGVESPAADFEMIALFVDLLDTVGLRETRVRLNSVGDATCRPAYTETLRVYLRAHAASLCPDCVRRTEENPLRVLDCKVPGCREIARGIPRIQEHLCEACRAHQETLRDLLDAAGLQYEMADHLVRGLDYYTRTVFEVEHGGLGAQSAVGGGGRYDRLVEDVGGPATPGVGFSSGIERILLALEAEGARLPGLERPEIMVITVGERAERRAAMVLARRLRRRFRVDMDLRGRSLAAQMKVADRAGARVALLVGEGELASGQWTVKDLVSGAQEHVGDEDLEARLSALLGLGKGTA